MFKFTRLLQVFLLLAITHISFGQALSGTYSIGALGIVTGEVGNYPTFSAAINALNVNGGQWSLHFYFY